MDALTNLIAYQSVSMKADLLQEVYTSKLAKETMNMEEQLAANELAMLPQIPKGQYIDVYA